MTSRTAWLVAAGCAAMVLAGAAALRQARHDVRFRIHALPATARGAYGAHVALDSNGLGVVAYRSPNGIEVLEQTPGERWSVRSMASKLGHDTLPEDLVAGPDGALALAFVRVQAGKSSVFVSGRDVHGAWHDPEDQRDALSFAPTAYAPRLACDASGRWLLTLNQWYDPAHYGVAILERSAGERQWRRPARPDAVLSPPLFFSNLPAVTLDDEGRALVGWFQSVGGPLRAFVSERRTAGAPFSHPQPDDALSSPERAVRSEPYANVRPALAPDGSAAVVWTEEDDSEARVYVSSRPAGGGWARPARAVSPSGQRARTAGISFGPGSTLFVVWVDGDSPRGRVVLARRARDGTWLDSHPLELSTPGYRAWGAMLKANATHALVAWQEQGASGPPRVAVRALGHGEPGSIQVLSDGEAPALALDSKGRAIVAWHRGARPTSSIAVATATLE